MLDDRLTVHQLPQMAGFDESRLTVVVAFDFGYQIHDKACWRWLEKWLLLDPSSINLTLLHIETVRDPAKLELTSYRYISLEDSSRFLPYDVWRSLRRNKYPHHEVVLLQTNIGISKSILDYMRYDAPRHAMLVLGSRHHTPSIIPRFLMGSVSSDVTAKIDSHPVLLIRTRLFKDVSDLREDTVGSAYLGLREEGKEFGCGRSICIAVDGAHVKSLVHYVMREIMRKTDIVQIVHCAADESASTLARVSAELEEIREELKTFLDDENQLDSVLLDFTGDIREKVLEHVDERMSSKAIDLLVIGNRTRRAVLSRNIIGSTAQYILQYAHVPVLMVPDALIEYMEDDAMSTAA
jgi:nucleotide-binding universal stress UspA family protein